MTTTTEITAATTEVPTAVPDPNRLGLHRLIRSIPWTLRIALLLLVLAGIVGVLALTVPTLRDFAARQSLADAFQPPFGDGGLLGTDQLGRSMAWRLLAGLGISLLVALSVTVLSMVFGLCMGVLGGFFGRAADQAVSVLTDVAWAYPTVLLAVVAAGVVGPGMTAVILALGLSIWAAFARIVRAQVLSLRTQEYVLAARALGYGRLYIATHHLIPSLVPIALVMGSLYIALAVIAEAGLSFIGLGAQAPTPSLGTALAEGYTYVSTSPWPIMLAAALIIAMVTTFNNLSDHLRNVLDPHHDGGPNRRVIPARPGRDVSAPPSLERANNMETVQVSDLTVVKRNEDGDTVPIVSNVSLDIRRNQVLGIVGESGSGKSITARAILNLLPPGLEMAEASRVTWAGDDIRTLGPEELRQRRGPVVSMVFQDARASLDPLYSIGAQILESVRAHETISTSTAREHVLDMLARVGLDEPREYYGRYPHQLSGGQLQRVMIAASLVLRPKVLIADEPTTGLDATTQKRIVELIQSLQRDLDLAIVWITHDLELVSEITTQLVVMYAGEAVESGPTKRLLNAPRHPYTSALLESRPQMAERKSFLRTIGGEVPGPGEWPAACRFAPRCPRVVAGCTTAHPSFVEFTDGSSTTALRCINPQPVERS